MCWLTRYLQERSLVEKTSRQSQGKSPKRGEAQAACQDVTCPPSREGLTATLGESTRRAPAPRRWLKDHGAARAGHRGSLAAGSKTAARQCSSPGVDSRGPGTRESARRWVPRRDNRRGLTRGAERGFQGELSRDGTGADRRRGTRRPRSRPPRHKRGGRLGGLHRARQPRNGESARCDALVKR